MKDNELLHIIEKRNKPEYSKHIESLILSIMDSEELAYPLSMDYFYKNLNKRILYEFSQSEDSTVAFSLRDDDIDFNSIYTAIIVKNSAYGGLPYTYIDAADVLNSLNELATLDNTGYYYSHDNRIKKVTVEDGVVIINLSMGATVTFQDDILGYYMTIEPFHHVLMPNYYDKQGIYVHIHKSGLFNKGLYCVVGTNKAETNTLKELDRNYL